MNEFESAAMWKLYTLAHESICIQTTYEKLRLHMPTNVHIGTISYIDYNADVVNEGNAFNFIMIKRRSFDHERELRAVCMHAEDPIADGIWVESNLSLLLDNVYLSPTAPLWFLDSVDDLSRHYGLTVPVRQSMLGVSPIY